MASLSGAKQDLKKLKKIGDMRLRESYYNSGTTANRPTLGTGDVGFMYFDTTIKAAVWWDGTKWTDQYSL